MMQLLKENIARQGKAMVLLRVLLEEEFSALMERNTRSVSSLELSIQELMRQLMAERDSLARVVLTVSGGAVQRVRELMPSLSEQQAAELEEQLQDLDANEQVCARQAARNQQFALALHEQSSKLLKYMHGKIKPTKTEGYSAKGRYASRPGESRLVRGTL